MSYAGITGLNVVTSDGMRCARRSVTTVRSLFESAAIYETQIPFLVPNVLMHSLQDLKLLWGPELRGGRNQRVQGSLVQAGAHVAALPYLADMVKSYRDLPLGLFSADAAWLGGEQWEDVICINGVRAEPRDGDTTAMQTLVAVALDCLGMETISIPQLLFWAPGAHIVSAHTWWHGSHLAAACTTLAGASLRDAAIRYDQGPARPRPVANVSFFYLSQHTLLREEA